MTSAGETTVVLRALPATSKAVICESATLAFQGCQEGMGGVEYMGTCLAVCFQNHLN